MENFNAPYGNHPKLELLKHFCLEYGTYVEMNKKEQFSTQGKINDRGAYIQDGLFRYTCDDRDNTHIVGYAFSGEFTGGWDSLINPNQPSLVTIKPVCDSKIYRVLFSQVDKYFSTNLETQQIRCVFAEQSYSLMYRRLLDLYGRTTAELYTDLQNRWPDIQKCITLKEIASFLQVASETISHIRRKLKIIVENLTLII